MVFKKDSKGLGYYKDIKPVAGSPAARVPGQPNKASAEDWASKKVEAMAWKTMSGNLKYRDSVQGRCLRVRMRVTV